MMEINTQGTLTAKKKKKVKIKNVHMPLFSNSEPFLSESKHSLILTDRNNNFNFSHEYFCDIVKGIVALRQHTLDYFYLNTMTSNYKLCNTSQIGV